MYRMNEVMNCLSKHFRQIIGLYAAHDLDAIIDHYYS